MQRRGSSLHKLRVDGLANQSLYTSKNPWRYITKGSTGKTLKLFRGGLFRRTNEYACARVLAAAAAPGSAIKLYQNNSVAFAKICIYAFVNERAIVVDCLYVE